MSAMNLIHEVCGNLCAEDMELDVLIDGDNEDIVTIKVSTRTSDDAVIAWCFQISISELEIASYPEDLLSIPMAKAVNDLARLKKNIELSEK